MFSTEPFELNAVKLTSGVNIGQYRRMEDARDMDGLVGVVQQRLRERYVDPVAAIHATRRNGFHIVAISCLLIETMEAFRQGWSNTDKGVHLTAIRGACKPSGSKAERVSRSKLAFCYFFEREAAFADLRLCSYEFYDNVRCGILHQGETTGGWRVCREGALFNPDALAINASKFFREVKNALQGYCDLLGESDWDSQLWKNLRSKMDSTIRHCERPS